jgi:hypothetical protein
MQRQEAANDVWKQAIAAQTGRFADLTEARAAREAAEKKDEPYGKRLAAMEEAGKAEERLAECRAKSQKPKSADRSLKGQAARIAAAQTPCQPWIRPSGFPGGPAAAAGPVPGRPPGAAARPGEPMISAEPPGAAGSLLT